VMKFLVFVVLAVTSAWKYTGQYFDPNKPCFIPPNKTKSLVLTPEPYQWPNFTAPASYDIRNVNGIDYASTDLNQHIPHYCGSCWCHGAMSSVADRLNLNQKRMTADHIPSIQAIINCGDAGSCNGGSDSEAYAWVEKNGVPDVTCQQYQAKNMDCDSLALCENCSPGGGCVKVTKYPKIGIKQYGSVREDEKIEAEISARGPVSCGINAGPLEDYTGGILKDYSGGVNHVIQLAGYGTSDGTKYWLGRNSWGTYWGERGWFRIIRGGPYSPHCNWAIPTMPQYD